MKDYFVYLKTSLFNSPSSNQQLNSPYGLSLDEDNSYIYGRDQLSGYPDTHSFM